MKRSSHVALLLMGMGSVGAGAYALSPPRNCSQPDGAPPAAVSPATGQPAQECPPRRRWSSWSSSNSHSYSSYSSSSSPGRSSAGWFSRGSHQGTATSVIPSAGRTGGVARGGFGATGASHSASS